VTDASNTLSSGSALRAISTAALLALAPAAQAALPPFASVTPISDVSNYCYPKAWQHHGMDVTSLVAGAANAQLSFGFKTQLVPGTTYTPAGTHAHLYCASDSACAYLKRG
jgi:hypothetical protein